jgi:hypothetical protein
MLMAFLWSSFLGSHRQGGQLFLGPHLRGGRVKSRTLLRFTEMKNRLFKTFAFLTFLTSSVVTFGDDWKNSAGTKSIKGEFVKLDGIKLTIKKDDGTEMTIPLYMLDDKSRLKARALARGDKESDSGDSGGAETMLVSAKPLNESDVEAKFAEMKTAKEYIDFLASEQERKNYLISWDALPPSYQVQFEGIYDQVVGKLEQAALTDIAKFRKELVDALRSKKKMILASKEIPPMVLPMVEPLYDPIVSFVEHAIPDSTLKIEKLRSTKPRALLAEVMETAFPKMEKIMNKLPAGMNPLDMQKQMAQSQKVTEISSTEAEMTIQTQFGEMKQRLIRIENRWMQKDQMDAMQAGVNQAMEWAKNTDGKTLTRTIRQGMSVARIPVGMLGNAETQSDIDDILKQLMANAMQGLPGGGMPGGMPGGGPPGAR